MESGTRPYPEIAALRLLVEGEEAFPEADALVQCLFDARWEGLYEPASAESLREGLIQDRRRGPRK